MDITFCINTANNERYHVELLFASLKQNLSKLTYNILVFIDSDNQKTRDFLLTQKEYFPNLKIIKNPLPIPIGYARNINLMFEMATTEIVSYLQSDMVICKNYDLEITKHLDENTIISSTRVEPPLHPPSFEKITHNWGLDPQTFQLDEFSNWAETKKQNKLTEYWFAPFTLYRKKWVDIGGHDTLFRKSREDSDLLYRFSLSNTKTLQSWNAIVYHFTCTSSRGIEWWKKENNNRTELQKHADAIEMSRFNRKWPFFKHSAAYNPTTEYKYHTYLNLKNVSLNQYETILNNYFRFEKIYVDNIDVRHKLKIEYDKFHDVANYLLNITAGQWEQYKKYYRTLEFDDIFSTIPFDINSNYNVLDVDMNVDNIFSNLMLLELNTIINQTKFTDGIGAYQFGNSTLYLNNFIDTLPLNVKVNNPPINDIDFMIL